MSFAVTFFNFPTRILHHTVGEVEEMTKQWRQPTGTALRNVREVKSRFQFAKNSGNFPMVCYDKHCPKSMDTILNKFILNLNNNILH